LFFFFQAGDFIFFPALVVFFLPLPAPIEIITCVSSRSILNGAAAAAVPGNNYGQSSGAIKRHPASAQGRMEEGQGT